jgi:hypothetical protein
MLHVKDFFDKMASRPNQNLILIMSWFAKGLSQISQLTEKVKKAIPIDREMLAKLTLILIK